MIEPKFFDATMNKNRLHIIMASNADWVVPASIDDRRFAVFDVSDKYRNDKSYFEPLYVEMEQGGIAAMMYDLLALDLGTWHPRYEVPQTQALGDQKIHSLSAEDEWWLGLLQAGDLPGPAHKNNPWLAQSQALLEHANKMFRMRYCTEHRLGRMLKKYGCDRNSDWRINGKRAWQFPPLKEARAAWDKKLGLETAWESTAEWEHSQDYM
jgi:Mesyanzhinovviridae DNA primase